MVTCSTSARHAECTSLLRESWADSCYYISVCVGLWHGFRMALDLITFWIVTHRCVLTVNQSIQFTIYISPSLVFVSGTLNATSSSSPLFHLSYQFADGAQTDSSTMSSVFMSRSRPASLSCHLQRFKCAGCSRPTPRRSQLAQCFSWIGMAGPRSRS